MQSKCIILIVLTSKVSWLLIQKLIHNLTAACQKAELISHFPQQKVNAYIAIYKIH